MSDSDKVFAGSIPEVYNTYLVPLIFDFYAEDLAARTEALRPQTILETAAGSGVVTRAMAPRLKQNSEYFVTDLNQPMLEQAKKMQGADDRITWRQANALELPFSNGDFDAVICQFGVMFFPDKIAGYKEAHRVLKPGATFLFSVWDDIAANDFANLVTEAAGKVFPDDPPRFLARTPHGYCDTSDIVSELASAGFADISVETIETNSTAPSPRHPAIAYCHGTPLRNEIEARDKQGLDRVTDLAEKFIADAFGREQVVGKIRAHIFTATAGP